MSRRPLSRRPLSRGRSLSVLARLVVLAAGVAACGGPVLANPPVPRPVVTPGPVVAVRPPDPQPVVLPQDDAPHDRLTEWWYYTGHLRDDTGGRWGFEFVVFRAERGGFPVTWASHLALTDETAGRFHYAQRAEIGPQADRGGSASAGDPVARPAFDLAIGGLDPTDPAARDRDPWSMSGTDGSDTLDARAADTEVLGDAAPGFGLSLALRATKPPALHGGSGYIDFGPAGGSYYYSRTAMTADGTVTVGDRVMAVNGTAWFDHQWGDFIAVGGGGWDWFAVNLDDGTDITLSLVRAADGSYPLAYGTLVEPSGITRHLDRDSFAVTVTDHWVSPATGAAWPAGWAVTLPREGLSIRLAPTVPHQELDTRATTGVVYWEGSQRVTATRDGNPLGGRAYVELTGYADAP
jgi:predicted secreted hydrolase